jgi:translation initiation factor IF-3
VGEKGEQLGIMPISQALEMARRHDLDLVEVAPTATPPVCRLLDYGKYKYEQSKKEREQRRRGFRCCAKSGCGPRLILTTSTPKPER